MAVSRASRIEALRRLAERPGTEHEGLVARKMLKRLKAKTATKPEPDSVPAKYRMAEFWNGGNPVVIQCHCGEMFTSRTPCEQSSRHERIRAEILSRFAVGDRVFFNRYGYLLNAAANIIKVFDKAADKWNSVQLKFEGSGKTKAITVLAYSIYGWHLSKSPLNFTEAGNLRRPDADHTQWTARLG